MGETKGDLSQAVRRTRGPAEEQFGTKRGFLILTKVPESDLRCNQCIFTMLIYLAFDVFMSMEALNGSPEHWPLTCSHKGVCPEAPSG